MELTLTIQCGDGPGVNNNKEQIHSDEEIWVFFFTPTRGFKFTTDEYFKDRI